MFIVNIKKEKLNLDSLIDTLKNPKSGAISIFSGNQSFFKQKGITRDNFEGKQVSKLYYECYEPMALKKMKQICNYCLAKYELNGIGIEHRIGIVVTYTKI